MSDAPGRSGRIWCRSSRRRCAEPGAARPVPPAGEDRPRAGTCSPQPMEAASSLPRAATGPAAAPRPGRGGGARWRGPRLQFQPPAIQENHAALEDVATNLAALPYADWHQRPGYWGDLTRHSRRAPVCWTSVVARVARGPLQRVHRRRDGPAAVEHATSLGRKVLHSDVSASHCLSATDLRGDRPQGRPRARTRSAALVQRRAASSRRADSSTRRPDAQRWVGTTRARPALHTSRLQASLHGSRISIEQAGYESVIGERALSALLGGTAVRPSSTSLPGSTSESERLGPWPVLGPTRARARRAAGLSRPRVPAAVSQPSAREIRPKRPVGGDAADPSDQTELVIEWKDERAVARDLAERRNVACDHRTSARHRFQRREAEAFVTGRVQEGERAAVEPVKAPVGDVLDEPDRSREPPRRSSTRARRRRSPDAPRAPGRRLRRIGRMPDDEREACCRRASPRRADPDELACDRRIVLVGLNEARPQWMTRVRAASPPSGRTASSRANADAATTASARRRPTAGRRASMSAAAARARSRARSGVIERGHDRSSRGSTGPSRTKKCSRSMRAPRDGLLEQEPHRPRPSAPSGSPAA